MSGRDQKPEGIEKLIKIVIFALIIFIALNFLYHNSGLFYRKTVHTPFSLHLNTNDLYMIKGEEFHLFVYDINKRVSFSSTNFRVAGVNFNGRVYAFRTGKAFIIAKVGSKELRCRVHVIDINKRSLELTVGKTYKLKISGSNSFVKWSSSNKEIASVNIFGKVTVKGEGTTIIYAKVKGKKLQCEIKVH